MTHNLTDLLPPERAHAIRALYFLRLATAGVLLLAAVALVHGVLLLPSYLLANGLERERAAALTSLSNGTVSEETEASARALRLQSDATYLARLGTVPKSSAAIRAVIALPSDGIDLVGFAFMPTADGASMSLSGKATTREALRRYEATLEGAPFVDTVDLPISAYAKENDIDFTMTLTGPFLP